jgi:hypothetical protein
MKRNSSFSSSRSPCAPVLGVDIGRVLIHGDGPDTSFIGGSEEDAVKAPPMEGALESLTRLSVRLGGRIWLVSKCGPKVQARTIRWLDHHRFFEATGIPAGQLRFCRERHEKAPICAKLGIRLFVDDRLDVLSAMQGVVPYRFQFGVMSAPAGIHPVATWSDAEAAILAALAGATSAS